MPILRVWSFRDYSVLVNVAILTHHAREHQSSIRGNRRSVSFADDGVISAGHGAVVEFGGFRAAARITIEEVEEGFMGVVIEMVDFVPPCEQVRHRFGGRLVCDCRADYIRHVAMIELRRYRKFSPTVKAAYGSKMDVTAQYSDAYTVLLRKDLQAKDELFTFLFVLARSVVVIEIVEKIDLAVKTVEEVARKTEAFVEETNWSYYRGCKDILQPCQPRIGDRNTQKHNEVIYLWGIRKF